MDLILQAAEPVPKDVVQWVVGKSSLVKTNHVQRCTGNPSKHQDGPVMSEIVLQDNLSGQEEDAK